MSDFASFQIRGRLTRDPQLRYVGAKHTPLCEFGVGVNRERNGQKQPPEFYDCKAWGEMAEAMAQNYQKGAQFCGQGALSFETWEDKSTGTKRSKVTLTVFRDSLDDDERKLSGGGQRQQPQRQQPDRSGGYGAQKAPENEPPYGNEQQFKDDDIPF